jgi:hypothetical protein
MSGKSKVQSPEPKVQSPRSHGEDSGLWTLDFRLCRVTHSDDMTECGKPLNIPVKVYSS